MKQKNERGKGKKKYNYYYEHNDCLNSNLKYKTYVFWINYLVYDNVFKILSLYLTTRLVGVSFGFNAQVLTTYGKILYLRQPFPCDQYGWRICLLLHAR